MNLVSAPIIGSTGAGVKVGLVAAASECLGIVSCDHHHDTDQNDHHEKAIIEVLDETDQIQCTTPLRPTSEQAYHSASYPVTRRLPSSAITLGRAIVVKTVVHLGPARDVIPEVAIAHDIEHHTDQCGDQRKGYDNGVEHFFASCDVLDSFLSQVARSPK